MKVSWDDDIPNIWKVTKNVPNHQSDYPRYCSFLIGFLAILRTTI